MFKHIPNNWIQQDLLALGCKTQGLRSEATKPKDLRAYSSRLVCYFNFGLVKEAIKTHKPSFKTDGNAGSFFDKPWLREDPKGRAASGSGPFATLMASKHLRSFSRGTLVPS